MAHFFAALLAILQPETAPALPPLDARWAVTFNSVPAATPGYDRASAYIPLKGGQLVAINLDRGTIRWTLDIATAFTPASGEGLVFIAGDQTIEARDAETGANRWSTPQPGGVAVPLFYDTGWLLASTTSGDLIALRASDGAVVWRRQLGAPLAGPPGPALDRLYLSLEDNRLVSVLLTNGEMVVDPRNAGARDRFARTRRPARGRHRRQACDEHQPRQRTRAMGLGGWR